MPDPSFVLDLHVLVRQGIVRPGAFLRDARVGFVDPASGRVWGVVGLEVDTRLPDDLKATVRYFLVRTGERIDLVVPLRIDTASTGFRWRFACPLGCRRTTVRLHLPGGASRFGCRACLGRLLRRSEGPPAVRPIPAEAPRLRP